MHTNHTIDRDDGQRATATLRTPYHTLGDEHGVRVPTWVKHRSVYRGAGRTTYLVETDELAAATADLAQLADTGWDVLVQRAGRSDALARVLLSQHDFARAA